MTWRIGQEGLPRGGNWPEGLTSRNGPRGIVQRDLTIEELARVAGPGKIGQEGFTWKILEKKIGLDGLGAYFS